MLRNVLGVIAGFALWSVLWLGGAMALRAVAPGAFDEQGTVVDPGVLAALLGLSATCSLASGWLAAAIGRRARLATTLALGIVLLGVGVMVQMSVWDQMPLWYHVPFLGLLIPASAAGGALVRTDPAGIMSA